MAAASGAFRSHLMQQFVSAARTQSRPPLALSLGLKSRTSLPTLTESPSSDEPVDESSRAATSVYQTLQLAAAGEVPPSSSRRRSIHSVLSEKSFSNQFILNRPTDTQDDDISNDSSITAFDMQSMIQNRRTVSNFEKSSRNIREALERAVLCGLNAPNHHNTQAFTFKRLLSPSEATARLADIAYNVILRKKPDSENNQRLAERKREKWSQIPGFLVTLVDGQPSQERRDVGEYEECPFVGPATEKQLEDYAAACAAVQNVLLSLHAEGIGAKWATGPVTRTPAFRSLVQAQDDERIVALIMVGHPRRVPRAPRRERPMAELFQDL